MQTALQEITDHIKTGLNKNKPIDQTVIVAIDLSKAFDAVDHKILQNDISELPLNSNLKQFLASYLRGRQTYVEFRGAKSKPGKSAKESPQEEYCCQYSSTCTCLRSHPLLPT